MKYMIKLKKNMTNFKDVSQSVALIIVSIFFISTSFSNNIGKIIVQSEFCEGWEDGYCEGWKEIKGRLSICPVTPVCPVPEIGRNSYKGGYNTGFVAGMRAAE